MIPKFLCTNTAQKTLIVFALFIFSSSAFSQSAFATIWRTTSSGESITIPTFTGETYDYTVDWGDGSSSDTNVMGDVTHNYAVSGDYLIIITGLFPRIYFNCEGDKLKIISIEEWGANPWTSMNSAFVCCENLVINAGDAPNLSGVTDLGIMFTGAIYFDGDLTSWDVSKVTNMDHMFADARAFHGGLGSWDVSSVIDMSGMFLGATAFNDDLSWDISNVLDMTDMFADVTLSTTNYDNTLIGWSTLTAGETQIPTFINFNGGNSTYCNGEAARLSLTGSTYNWNITDGGLDCTSLGLDDYDLTTSLKLYPNPVGNEFRIVELLENSILEIYNLNGLLVQKLHNYKGTR